MAKGSLRTQACIIMLVSVLVFMLCLFGCSSGTDLDKSVTFHGLTYKVSSNWTQDEPFEYELDDGSEIGITEYYSADNSFRVTVYYSSEDTTIENAVRESLDDIESAYADEGYEVSNTQYSKERDLEISNTEGALYKLSYVLSDGRDQETVTYWAAYIEGSQMQYEIDVVDASSQSNALSTLESILDTVSVKS